MKNIIFLISFILLSVVSSKAQNTANYNLQGKLAIQGYDAVAYFASGKPTKGNKMYSSVVEGVVYYFASTQHKTAFDAEPNRYMPQYGGWCAYAMGAKGEKVEIDPETFKILGGKLYLFYNAYFNNTLKTWNQDEKKLKLQADKNWAKFN